MKPKFATEPPAPEPVSPTRRWIAIGSMAAVVALLLMGGYFALKKFLTDRLMAENYRQRPDFTRRLITKNGQTTRTYTQKELETMRRTGKTPPNMPVLPPQGPSSSDAAIQRTLRTLDEINRINQMNQKLMEEQQRMNRNK